MRKLYGCRQMRKISADSDCLEKLDRPISRRVMTPAFLEDFGEVAFKRNRRAAPAIAASANRLDSQRLVIVPMVICNSGPLAIGAREFGWVHEKSIFHRAADDQAGALLAAPDLSTAELVDARGATKSSGAPACHYDRAAIAAGEATQSSRLAAHAITCSVAVRSLESLRIVPIVTL